MAEILSTISLLSFIVSGAAFLAAVFCWFKFKIPQAVGDLSGHTAKKSIERMRADYEKSGSKYFRSVKSAVEGAMEETGLLAENRSRNMREEKTCLLTEELSRDSLAEETILLVNDEVISSCQGGKQLTMLEEIIMIHTNEVIR